VEISGSHNTAVRQFRAGEGASATKPAGPIYWIAITSLTGRARQGRPPIRREVSSNAPGRYHVPVATGPFELTGVLMRTTLLALALLLAAVQLPAQQAQASGPVGPPLFVGVVRGDGVMVPIASRHDGDWADLRLFDAAAGRGVIRTRNRDVIPRTGWTLHTLTEPSRPLALGGDVIADAHCVTQEAFATGARPASGVIAAPVAAWAVAVNGDVAVAAVEDVRRGPDEAARRVARFVAGFTNASEAAVSSAPALGAVSAADRARATVEIRTLQRDRVSTYRDVYYFDAQKSYGRVRTFANGWIDSTSNRLSLQDVAVGVDAGGESVRRTGRVLGALRIGPNSAWIVEMQYYEGTSYDLVQMGPAAQVVRASAGGC
jgi:hypothetical protein